MAKRRRFTPQFKAQVVLEMLRGERSLPEAARHYRIHASVLRAWQEHLATDAPKLFGDESIEQTQRERIAELERLVGRLTLELDMAKKVSAVLKPTTDGTWR